MCKIGKCQWAIQKEFERRAYSWINSFIVVTSINIRIVQWCIFQKFTKIWLVTITITKQSQNVSQEFLHLRSNEKQNNASSESQKALQYNTNKSLTHLLPVHQFFFYSVFFTAQLHARPLCYLNERSSQTQPAAFTAHRNTCGKNKKQKKANVYSTVASTVTI